jgi:HPt (histidine-containing phosphotransfer) domain-containing protein
MDEFMQNNKIPLPDLSYLEDMTGGDKDSLKEIVAIFLDEGPRLMNLMKESAEAGDTAQLKFSTHKLITQLTYVGINSVVPDVKLINNGSIKQEDLAERIAYISRVVDFSIEYLRKFVNT